MDENIITLESCSIVLDGIGRRAYINNTSGRVALLNDCTEHEEMDVYDEVMNVWGENPTVPDEPLPPEPTLEELKQQKKDEIAAARYDWEISGIDYKNVHISTDREDQSMITAIALSATLNNDFTTVWKGTNGYINLNSQEILTLAYLVAEHVETAFAEEKRLAELIDSAQNEEELNTIVWSLKI